MILDRETVELLTSLSPEAKREAIEILTSTPRPASNMSTDELLAEADRIRSACRGRINIVKTLHEGRDRR